MKEFSLSLGCLGCLLGRVFTLTVEGQGFATLVVSSQRLKNWHLLFP